MLKTAERILPPEVWSMIIDSLPYSSKILALGVSRVFHDALVPRLFSNIRVYIATPEMQDLFDYDEYEVEDIMRLSWEKLNHISMHPRFAHQVKALTISIYGQHPLHFEKLSLRQAIQSMPNLKAFYWFGTFTKMAIELLGDLPSSVKTLRTNAFRASEWPVQLTNLKCLNLGSIDYYPSQAGYYTDDLLDWYNLHNAVDLPPYIIQKEMVSNIKPLQSLTIRSDTLEALPIAVINTLKELELVVAEGDIHGLDLLVRHAQALESLSIVGFVEADLLQFLSQHAHTLPHLTSFRLSCEVYESLVIMTEEQAVALAGFISSHKLLRRLYIRVAGSRWDVLRNLTPCIKNLPGLEVLGLHLGRVFLSAADVEEVTALLGSRLTALHLTLPWTHPSLADVNINALTPLMQRLKELPLRYLHLFSLGRPLPVDAEELAGELNGLQTIGLNRHLWSRDGIELWEWNQQTLVTAHEEDFSSKDHYWLFKYH